MKTVILKRNSYGINVVRTYKELVPLSVGDVLVIEGREFEVMRVRLNTDKQQYEIEYFEYEY
jgi:hypothetical protein